MENIKNIWNQKQTYEKLLAALGIICSLSVIIVAGFQLSGIMEDTLKICQPLLGVLMLIQSIQNWKKNKFLSMFSLGVAIFIFCIAIYLFVI